MKIGIVPQEEIPENFMDTAEPGWNQEKRICEEGFVEFHWWKRDEGTFKCPAMRDQVPSASELYRSSPGQSATDCLGRPVGDPTMAGGWGNSFSINGNLCKGYAQKVSADGDSIAYSPLPRCVKITDIKRPAILIGDGAITQDMTAVRSRYEVDEEGGLLGYATKSLPKNDKSRLMHSGPWPMMTLFGLRGSRWGSPSESDGGDHWYGHPGESANLTYTDGHVSNQSSPKPSDWRIN